MIENYAMTQIISINDEHDMTVKGGRCLWRRVEITSSLENHLKSACKSASNRPLSCLHRVKNICYLWRSFGSLIVRLSSRLSSKPFTSREVRIIMTGTAHINRWWQMNRSRFERLMGRDKFLRLPMCQSVKRLFRTRWKLCNLRFVKNISFDMSAESSIAFCVFFGRLGQVPAPFTMIILLRQRVGSGRRQWL